MASTYSYPGKTLFRMLLPIMVIAVLCSSLAIRSVLLGRYDLAIVSLILGCAGSIVPGLLIFPTFSTISVGDDGVSAYIFGGFRWAHNRWADIDYLQRVRVFTVLGKESKPDSETYYVGSGSRKAFRIMFRNSIGGIDELKLALDHGAAERGIPIYSIDTTPKQYGFARSGTVINGLSQ